MIDETIMRAARRTLRRGLEPLEAALRENARLKLEFDRVKSENTRLHAELAEARKINGMQAKLAEEAKGKGDARKDASL